LSESLGLQVPRQSLGGECECAKPYLLDIIPMARQRRPRTHLKEETTLHFKGQLAWALRQWKKGKRAFRDSLKGAEVQCASGRMGTIKGEKKKVKNTAMDGFIIKDRRPGEFWTPGGDKG